MIKIQNKIEPLCRSRWRNKQYYLVWTLRIFSVWISFYRKSKHLKMYKTRYKVNTIAGNMHIYGFKLDGLCTKNMITLAVINFETGRDEIKAFPKEVLEESLLPLDYITAIGQYLTVLERESRKSEIPSKLAN